MLSQINAYTKNSLLTKSSGTSSFEDYLENLTRGAADGLKKSESTTLQALEGKASALDVILTLQEAELQLQTMTAVHQKGIEAYQRIMQMQV